MDDAPIREPSGESQTPPRPSSAPPIDINPETSKTVATVDGDLCLPSGEKITLSMVKDCFLGSTAYRMDQPMTREEQFMAGFAATLKERGLDQRPPLRAARQRTGHSTYTSVPLLEQMRQAVHSSPVPSTSRASSSVHATIKYMMKIKPADPVTTSTPVDSAKQGSKRKESSSSNVPSPKRPCRSSASGDVLADKPIKVELDLPTLLPTERTRTSASVGSDETGMDSSFEQLEGYREDQRAARRRATQDTPVAAFKPYLAQSGFLVHNL